MALYGPNGERIDLGKLKHQEIATAGSSAFLSSHPSSGLTPGRLARILRSSEQGDATAYLELAEEMEEKDLHYLGVLGTRKRQVAQLEITIEAASDEKAAVRHADFLREWITRDSLQEELFEILDAVGKGFSVIEILWETTAKEWRPRALVWRDPRWIRFDPVSDQPMLRAEEGDARPSPIAARPLPPYKFLFHKMRAKSGSVLSGGLARAAAWAYLFKNYTIKDWAIFTETFGQPLRVGKYDGSASPADKATLLRAVERIGSDAAAIIPESMRIEFIEARSKDTKLFEERADWLDRQVSKAVLGQTATADAIKGGYAVGRVHQEVREDIERADALQLAATLNRDLVRPMIDLNFGPQAIYPRLRIGRQDQVNIAEVTDVLAKLVPLGLRVEQSVVRDMLSLPDPDDGAELLAPPSVAPNPTPVAEKADRAAKPKGDIAQAAAAAAAEDADAIDRAIGDTLAEEGWQPLIEPMLAGLAERLASATTEAEAAARLAEHFAAMGTEALAERLAQLLFAARLAGEAEWPLDDRTDA